MAPQSHLSIFASLHVNGKTAQLSEIKTFNVYTPKGQINDIRQWRKRFQRPPHTATTKSDEPK
jgi:hypothetical protein